MLEYNISNDQAEIATMPGSTELKFSMNFKVLYRQEAPQIKFSKVPEAKYNMPSWSIDKLCDEHQNEFLPHEWKAALSNEVGYSFNYLKSGELINVRCGKVQNTEGIVSYKYDEKRFCLEAEVSVPAGKDPVVELTFTPKINGWFSVGYAGAPKMPIDEAEAVWQPMIWMDKCFPRDSYLTTEFNCSVPAALVSSNGFTYGVVVDPTEMPYRMPTAKNSRFGVMLRNMEGMAQPMVFAPVLGGPESYMEAEDSYSFKIRLVAQKGNWVNAFEYIARNIYEFKDLRKNVTCSLTETIHNMVDYAMNDYYSKWNSELKGCSYQTDVPGSVKNVSALHMIGMAYIMDSREILEQRALPMIEYLMSRERLLFAMREDVKGQGASHNLNGPCITVSELASLYNMFYRQTSVFKQEALKQYHQRAAVSEFNKVGRSSEKGLTWQNALAVYRMTGDKKHLIKASELAKEYIIKDIDGMMENLEERNMFFWVDFVPKWADLTELYEETGDRVFLEVAHKSAKKYCSFIWYCPVIPNGDVMVNEDGKTSKYWYARGPEPMKIPEETVPAWRVSEIGLNSEAAGTGHGHRGVFMAFYAPYMMRLAKYTGDQFLHDTARSAIVGRYTNFPGYHMNTQRSTVYEKYDYPYHEFEELTYNTFHYNHIWPHTSMLMDYLISDVLYRSAGEISFPSQYAECYAYMQSKVYGDRPGKFYDEDDVWLWMPKGVMKTGSEQLNYVTARGNNNMYVVLTNQSEEAIDTNIYLDSSQVPCYKTGINHVKVWQQNVVCKTALMKCGVLPVHVEPRGITAIKIEGINIISNLLNSVKGTDVSEASENSYICINTDFGKITAMLIKLGDKYINNVYIWLSATEKVLKEVQLHYILDGKEYIETDESYPFEFTVALGKNTDIEFWVEVIKTNSETVKTENMKLKH